MQNRRTRRKHVTGLDAARDAFGARQCRRAAPCNRPCTLSSQFDRRTRLDRHARLVESCREPVVEITQRDHARLDEVGHAGHGAEQTVRLPGRCEQEALALVGDRLERLGPLHALPRARQHVRTSRDRAGRDAQGAARASQEQLELRAVAGPYQALQRGAVGQQAGVSASSLMRRISSLAEMPPSLTLASACCSAC